MAKKTNERRKHPRHNLNCPIRFYADEGVEIGCSQTTNISDSGVFATVSADIFAELNEKMDVTFSLPRSTPNTYMLEDFHSPARVIRQVPMRDSDDAGVALAFAKPLKLDITA